MNILLTGGAGYIGSHASVALIQAGHQVVLYDNFCNSHVDVLRRLKKITGKPCIVVQGDICDTFLLSKTLDRYAIDAVIHFAGFKAVGESTEKPLEYYANNVQGTLSLLKAMQEVTTKTLVFSSSSTVYGKPQYAPIDESHPTQPINPYGRSKLYIEKILADVAASDPTWRIASLRYFNPVGAHESGWIGEEPKGTPNNLMPYLLGVAANTLPYLSIFGNDYSTIDGTGIRDYIHVMDLVEGHLAALDYVSDHEEGLSVFNLGTGRGHSVFEMINAFEARIGKLITYEIKPRRLGDVDVCYAKVDKALVQLNWQAKRSLDDVMDSAWRWMSQLKKGIAA